MEKDNTIIVWENTTKTRVDEEVSSVGIENETLDVVVDDVAPLGVDISDDNIVDIEISEAFPFVTDGALEEDLQGKDILIDGGVALKEDQEVVRLEDILEKCAALGGSDNIAHGTLYGVEFPNQHPITAITNLREELDSIEALQTVYSDKQGCADYYPWEDENPAQEDRVGYFVAICGDARTIKICNSEDIFGVVVDRAAFVGGRDHILENHTIGGVGDVAQSSAYGLVATAGTAVVYCETDVEVGDYVISNDDGFAKKSGGNFGYLVIAINELEDIRSATISLTIPSTALAAMSDDINIVNQRIDVAETNITSAINIANAAYKMASENDNSVITNEELLEMVENAVADMNADMSRVESNLADAMVIVERAQKISENAAATAESIRKDAVETANKALDEVSRTVDGFNATVEEIKNTADSAETKAEAALEDVTGVNTRINEVQNNAQTALQNIESLEDELNALSNWSDDKGNSGVAGFVAKATADSTVLSEVVAWKSEASTSLAAVEKIADDNKGQIVLLAGRIDNNSNGISGLTTTVNSHASSLETFAKWQETVEDGSIDSIANVRSIAEANKTELNAVASYKKEHADGSSSKGLAGLVEQVNENQAYLSNLASYEYKDADGKVVADGTAGLVAQVNKNKSDLQLLAEFEGENGSGLAAMKASVTTSETELANIAEWQETVEDGSINSIASVRNIANSNKSAIDLLSKREDDSEKAIAALQVQTSKDSASICSIVSLIDTYSLGERSQANGLTLEQAANILEAGSVYVPTEDHSETYGEDVYEFSKGYHYTWDGTKWQESKSPFVAFSEQYVIGNDALNFWVPAANIIEDGIAYEKDTLYMWKDERWLAVATLKDNANSRATSMILQKQNEISLSVNNAHKDIAALDLRVDEAENHISLVVSKEGDDSVVNVASIVAAVNSDQSSVGINADKIVMTGTTTFLRPADVGENGGTVIDGGRIATGQVSAGNIDVSGVITAAEGDIKKLASEEIEATDVTAQNLKVKAANVEDKLTATQIDVTGLLTAAEGDIKNLVSETIAVTELNADNITSGTINASVVDVTNLSADNITSGAIDASVIDVTNLDADNITTGAISFNGGDYYISVTGDSGNYLVLPGLKISQEKAQFSGSIDVNKNFIVDEYGNVTLNGSISWGVGSSPTQIVYARDAIAAPESGTQLSDFPATDADGWHTSFSQTYDYFASYTYDGGKTWTDAVNIQGKDGSKPYVEDGYWYVDGVSTGVQVTYYTWVKYADTPTSGMSNIPDGKAYIGLAHNKTSTEASEDYDDYTWSLMKGEDGKDGKTYYTWVKYADDASGTNMSNDPTGKEYIGLAHNKETPTESTNASDYSWALFKGSDGVDGTDGKDGETPYIKESYWWIGATNTNIKAEGVDGADGQNGDTPYIKDGYWWIGDVNTNIQAEGKDGQDGKDGNNGSTVKVEYMYYSKQDSSAPETPQYPGNALTLGWSFTPQSAEPLAPYVFVSQCTVVDDVYGSWSTPTCWAKYGYDGSDANVTDINVFNALTNNGSMYGCFSSSDDKLYINASYIKSGQIDTGLLNVKEIISSGGIAVVSDIPDDDHITYITNDTISTTDVTAANLKVNMANVTDLLNVDGKITADKIDVDSLLAGYVTVGGLEGGTTTINGGCIKTGTINAKLLSSTGLTITGDSTIGPFYVLEDSLSALSKDGNFTSSISAYGASFPSIVTQDATISGGSLSGITSMSTDWVTVDSNSVSIRHPDDPYHLWHLSMSAGDSSASISGTGGSISFGSVVTLNGTWTAASCLGTSSDERVKNSIQSISTDERYDVMFDALAPSVYKYNDGTSGRTHTGYIAQDVLAAVESAGLTSTDFAGYMKAKTINPETGEETETCYLRYEEFIALNTYQIQKLKARVAELEAKLLGDA